MKKALAVFVLFLMFSVTLAFAAKFPAPVGYVNDFAKILDSDTARTLEGKISQYEKLTSIEIAIVTLKSLDGWADIEECAVELFKEWGIGKKSKDNGVLILVAPNDRKIRIEVGYGLEGDLTDGRAGQILDKFAIPAFKEGNYPKGIIQTVDGVISVLGGLSPQEREAQQAIRAEEERVRKEKAKERTAEFFQMALIIFVIVLVFVGLFLAGKFFVNLVKEHKRKALLRKEVVKLMGDERKKLEKAEALLKKSKEAAASFPDWASSKASALFSKISYGFSVAKSSHGFIDDNYRKKPDEAKSALNHATGELKKAVAYLGEVTQELPQEIKQYEEKAPKAVESVKQTIQAVSFFLANAQKKGFHFSDLEKKLASEENQILSAESLLNDKKNSREVVNHMAEVEKRIGSVKEAVSGIIELRNQNEKKIKTIPTTLSELQKNVPAAEKILDDMKKNNSRENWASLDKSFLLIAGLVAASEKLLSSATSSNSMEQQKFDAASDALEKVEKNLLDVKEIITSVAETKKEIDEAKKNHQSKLHSADSKVSEAASAVNHSDVKSSTKQLAKDAETKLSAAKRALSSNSINWLEVILLLTAAIELADDATSHARQDKHDAEAERERERKRREEKEKERRKQEQRAEEERRAAAKRAEESHRSSESHFGGFGGGNSGGGGASRSW